MTNIRPQPVRRHRLTIYVRSFGSLAIVIMLFSPSALFAAKPKAVPTRPGFHSEFRFDETVVSTPARLVVNNSGPEARPTVYVVGLPDTAQSPVPLTCGLALNGVRLAERLLSESVLILYPDGTGKWGYQMGFQSFRMPDIRDGRRIDPRTLLEYSKWKYDPLTPARGAIANPTMTLYALVNNGKPGVPLRYEIAFPDPVRIRKLTVGGACGAIREADTLVSVRLYADASLKERLAERQLGGERGKFPVVFEELGRSRVVVEVSGQSPKSILLYAGTLEAELDARGLVLPTLKPGDNVIEVTDDAASSHKARVVLCWGQPKPTAPRTVEIPPHVADYRSPYEGAKPRPREVPPLQEWFPTGFYDGTLSRSKAEVVWLLDQMKKFHMNTIYISNGTLDGSDDRVGLTGILPLANARGIRIVYQGTSCGALYLLGKTREQRLRNLERIILPTARKRIPEFKDEWSLAAWSLCEEIPPEYVAEVSPYYAAVRELAPRQPPTILHSPLAAAKADLETNRPLVTTHDCYPFFWSPWGGNPSNPGTSLAYYWGGLKSYYRACQEHGARLWMMPQAWGEDQGWTEATASLDPPRYGGRTGMRKPQPGEIKMQGWLAVAEGATGVMFYATVSRRPNSYQLWDYGFKETENTRAAGELFEKLMRVAPLLVRLERDFQESGFVQVAKGRVAANSFVKRQGYAGRARYVILASLDGLDPQEVGLTLQTEGPIYDLVARRAVTRAELADMHLGAGEGRIFMAGSEDDFQSDCRMIDEQLDKYYR